MLKQRGKMMPQPPEKPLFIDNNATQKRKIQCNNNHQIITKKLGTMP